MSNNIVLPAVIAVAVAVADLTSATPAIAGDHFEAAFASDSKIQNVSAAADRLLFDCVYTAELNPGIPIAPYTIIGRHFHVDIDNTRVIVNNHGIGDDVIIEINKDMIHYRSFAPHPSAILQFDTTINRTTGVFSMQATFIKTGAITRPQRAACTNEVISPNNL